MSPPYRESRRAVLIVVVLAASGCVDASSSHAPSNPTVALSFSPLAVASPGGLECVDSMVGAGLNRGEDTRIRAVRADFEGSGSVVTEVLDVSGGADSLTVPAVPAGRYQLDVSVCQASHEPHWVGHVSEVVVPDQGRVEAEVNLLPVGRFACTGTRDPGVADLYPDSPVVFASAASGNDGATAMIVGGVVDWTESVNGYATASDRILFFSGPKGSFAESARRLASPRAMAASVTVSWSGTARLLLVGGASTLAETSRMEMLKTLLPVGPLEGGEPWPVPPPEAIDVDTGQSEVLVNGPVLFAVGLGVSHGASSDTALVAGGVGLGGSDAVVSTGATLMDFGGTRVVMTPFELHHGRIAPAVVSVSEGVFWVIGGNVDHTGPEDPEALASLVSIVDARQLPPVVHPTRLTAADGGAVDGTLIRPAAFSHAIVTSGGDIVVVGGLPIPSRSLGVARVPGDPVIFRLRTDVDLTEETVDVTVASDPSYAELAGLSRRVFATQLDVDASTWLVGGVDGSQGTTFLPREDVLVVSRDGGSLSEGPAAPLIPVGGTATALYGGVEILVGGLIKSGVGIIAPSNHAVLYDSGIAAMPCVVPE